MIQKNTLQRRDIKVQTDELFLKYLLLLTLRLGQGCVHLCIASPLLLTTLNRISFIYKCALAPEIGSHRDLNWDRWIQTPER